jgi:hypothetical protein
MSRDDTNETRFRMRHGFGALYNEQLRVVSLCGLEVHMLVKVASVMIVAAGGAVGLAMADGTAERRTETVTTTVVAAAPQEAAPVARQEVVTTSKVGKELPKLKPGNSIVVHRNVRVVDAPDGRVDVGGMRVSMPSGIVIEDKDGVKHAMVLTATTAGVDGAVAIPDNTMGPGEPWWSISDRLSAERRLNEAEADAARAAADRPFMVYESGYAAPVYGWGNSGGVWNWSGRGPRGPVTTTVTRFDDLGSSAQRAYFDAAYPRNRATIEERDRAVREFNKAATPPINKTQDAVDKAHNDANRERAREEREAPKPRN